jgi:hypothetical protein
MAREYYTEIDLRGNRLTNALLTVEESDTATALYPEVGRIIIDDGVLKYHDGTDWKTVGEGTGGGGAAATKSFPYRWKTNTTAVDPTHGGIKGNASDKVLITEMYASAYDQNGVAVLGLLDMTIGSDIVVYEAGSGSTWNRYVLTEPPVPQGTPIEWVTLPVVYAETGALAFTPGNNTAVLLAISVLGASGVPAGGSAGQVLAKASADDYDTVWVTPTGGGGTASRYTHTQAVLAATWTINHNLGAHPVVGLEDAGGSTIYGTILHVNDNTLTVTFNRSCTGRANCI